MGVKKLQNNDAITLGLEIDEDGRQRCHRIFNNADIPEETKVHIYLPRKKMAGLNYLSKNFVKNYFMLYHHKHYHKFETVTGSHKEELL